MARPSVKRTNVHLSTGARWDGLDDATPQAPNNSSLWAALLVLSFRLNEIKGGTKSAPYLGRIGGGQEQWEIIMATTSTAEVRSP